MHLVPVSNVPHQANLSDGRIAKMSTPKMSVQVSHKRLHTEIEPLRDHMRPLDPPEIREIVVQKAKRARDCIYLTGDSDRGPPSKRSSRGHPNDAINAQTTASMSSHITPQFENGSTEIENLVEGVMYGSGFTQEADSIIASTNASYVSQGDNFEHFSEEESEISEASQLPKSMPFVDAGYEASFDPSQTWSTDKAELSEDDLADQLLRSDNLRFAGDRVGVAYGGISISKTSDQATQVAIALKAKIERDGVAKSKALRETAKLRNGRIVEQQHASKDPEPAKAPEYTSQEFGILDLFGRGKEINRRASESGSTPDDSDAISTVSSEHEVDTVLIRSSSEEDLFAEPQAYPRSVEKDPSNLGHRSWIEIEDLEAGAKKLETYTRLHEKKTGPSTLFIPRHELDKVGEAHFPSPARQKLHSAYGEPVKKDVLVRAQNKNGGLAMLAQKARLDDSASQSSLSLARTCGSPIQESERPRQSTSIDYSEFDFDFTKYKRQLTEGDRDVIRRSEWLKWRLKSLKTLQSAYETAANLSSKEGVTNAMERELQTIDDFKIIVLDQGKMDLKKRNSVMRIRENMAGRQKHKVSEAEEERLLGMLVDRKILQRLNYEIEIVAAEERDVGDQRYENTVKHKAHRPNRVRKKGKTERKVRFVSPDDQNTASKPKFRVLKDKIPKVAPPKRDSKEYRQNQKDAFEKSDAKRREALQGKLELLDQPETPTTPQSATAASNAAEEDAQSDVSEEIGDYEMYTSMGATQPALKPATVAEKVSLKEMERLDEERKQAEARVVAQPLPTATDTIRSGQAPDAALAERMRMAKLGIPEQNASPEILSDTDSEFSEDSDDSSAPIVIVYAVFGTYTGVAELDDCDVYKLGRFLKKERAVQTISEKMVEFTEARDRDIAAATAAGDEEWLARLGDPEEGKFHTDFKTKEQSMEYPASTCRIWMELERVQAKRREEKAAVVHVKTYVALWERTLPDGSKDGPSWDELVICSGPSGIWLANREAARIMGNWYGEHLKDGYLAMQMADLDEKVKILGEEGLFDQKDDFNGDEMKVWVAEKRNRA